MKKTYVFDFFNLYIPKGKKYVNKELGIRIVPLKFAEAFENERTKLSSPFSKDGWKTAKCYITAKNEDIAMGLAGAIEFLYSFAQNRSVFFTRWYKYNKGKKFFSIHSKFIEPRENRLSELIHGVKTRGCFYSRDISIFIDISLKTLTDATLYRNTEILTTIHAYNISESQMTQELKFLIAWIALEKLTNNHYNKYKSKNKLFTKGELKIIKGKLEKTLKKCLKKDERLPMITRSITRNFLYEHNTHQKILRYLDSLDLGFDKEKVNKLFVSLIGIRAKLVHNLNSTSLAKKPQYLYYLQKIMEIVIFRLLGIDKSLQEKFLLNQYKGTEL